MAAPVGNSDHLPETYEFLKLLKSPEAAIKGYSQGESNIFTPKAVLQDYFGRTRGSLRRLLAETLSGERHIPSTETVSKEFIAVYATLLVIGQPQFLKRFIEQGFCDDKLPFHIEPPSFPTTTDGGSLFERFKNAQWQFCPLRFRPDGINYYVQPEYILPLCRREILRRSPPATVYKVQVHRDYDPFEPNASAGSLVDHTYIFKEFNGAHAKAAYLQELDAFQHLQQASSSLGNTIIGFYGSFIYGESPVIILEYADRGTLDKFLQDIPSPEEGEDIIRIWEALLKLQVGINTIHNIPTGQLLVPADSRKQSALRGWHQDIKPSNILVLSGPTDSPYDCQFRLADLGTSHFTQVDGGETDVHAADAGGTREFGAPECYRLSHNMQQSAPRVQQKVDMWSLGCVYSEFAVWIVSGRQQLKNYKKDRQRETQEVGSTDVGCFHNGRGPLSCVEKWNQRAFDNKRSSDHVTRSVLKQLVGEMLYEDPDDRPSATQLMRKARDIISYARQQLDRQRRGSMGSTSTGPLARAPFRDYTLPSDSTTNNGTALSRAGPTKYSHPSSSIGEVQQQRPLEASPTTLSDSEAEDIHEDDPMLNTPLTSRCSSKRNFRSPATKSSYRHSNQEDDNHDDHNRSPANGMSRPGSCRPRTERRLKSSPASLEDINTAVGATVTREPQRSISNVDDVAEAFGTEFALQRVPVSAPRSPPTHDPSKDSRPVLSMVELYIRYSNRKRGLTIAPLTDEHYLHPLADPERDFVFLLDDSATMWQHKDQVIQAVMCLLWLLKKYDNDGIDMYFMRAKGKHHARPKYSSDLHLALLKYMTEAKGTSDVTNRLSTLLHDYTERYANNGTPRTPTSGRWSQLFSSKPALAKPSPLMIYVFTDAVWQAESDPAQLIKDTAEVLDKHNAPENQLGIQFISVNATDENCAKLNFLDSGLDINRDMVDTEPIDGNVFKMLLGPISRMWDGDRRQRA